jgi:hypothetical protein
LGGSLFQTSTTTDADGNFVLDHVAPAEKVVIWSYKYEEYYEDVTEPFTFNRPKDLEIPVVEVKAGQTITGVRIQLAQKVGKLHLLVHDADTRELVHGIYEQFCREGYPNNCLTSSDQPDSERMISLNVNISIKIEADDGQHRKWEYRNPRTGSAYFRATSGQTETINIFLRRKK